MPRRLTRPEVATRLAIKAVLDHDPNMTQKRLTAIFHVSCRTVSAASQKPVAGWVAALLQAPEPRHKMPALSPSPARKSGNTWQPGSRAKTKLQHPDPTIEWEEITDYEEQQPEDDEKAREEAITKEAERQDRIARGVKDKTEGED
nr:hypothetical protein [Candidatus Sigynarchaeota archaeon]